MTARGRLTDKPRDPERVGAERAALDLLRTGPATAAEIAAASGIDRERISGALKAIRVVDTKIVPSSNATGHLRATVYGFVKHVDVAVRRWGGGPVQHRKPKAPPDASDLSTPVVAAAAPGPTEVKPPERIPFVVRIAQVPADTKAANTVEISRFPLFLNAARVARVRALYCRGEVEAA